MMVSTRWIGVVAALSVAVGVGFPKVAGADTCEFTSTRAQVDYNALRPQLDELQKSVAKADSKAVTEQANKLVDSFNQLAADPENTVKIDPAGQRIAIHLANAPTTRLRLSFDGVETGSHLEVEWDPTVSSELARTVTLGKDTWRIVASVEPSTYTQTAGSVIIQTRFDDLQKSTTANDTAWKLQGTYVALVAALSTSGAAQEQKMSGWPRPTLTFQCAKALSMDDAHFAPAPAAATASGLRGYGVAPAAVTDTLSILAEIAVERAKAGAMQLLQNRLIKPFCTDSTKVSLSMLGLGHSDELALPRTCDLLTSLRLDDILSSGRPLLIALRDDLRHTVAPAAIGQLVGADSFANLALTSALTLVNTAIDRGGIDALDGQLALELLGDIQKAGVKLAPEIVTAMDPVIARVLTDADVQQFKLKLNLDCTSDCAVKVRALLEQLLQNPLAKVDDIFNDPSSLQPATIKVLRDAIASDDRAQKAVGYACQARLVVAAIKRCQHDGCSAEEVAGMLSKPDSYFAVDTKLPLALCWSDTNTYRAPPADAAAIQQLVIDGIHLVAPVVDGKGRDRAKAVVNLLVELLRRAEGTGTVDGNTQAFAEIANALIDEDYGTALNGFVHLAGKLRPGTVPPQLNKVVQLIGAVTSYAAVYKDTKDEDPKAARETRKQALESLINTATDRTGRDGDTILSIGSNVGLSATWTNAFDHVDDSRFEPAVRVPLGLSIDYPARALAFRWAIQLADLGQFVHHDSNNQTGDISWADFVSPGFEFGFSIPKIDRALNLSFHIAYAPTIATTDATTMTTRDGVWRFGLSLGYYVPFFDFN